MFSMLNISSIYVIWDGKLVGIISKNEFLKKQTNTILSNPIEPKIDKVEFPIENLLIRETLWKDLDQNTEFMVHHDDSPLKKP